MYHSPFQAFSYKKQWAKNRGEGRREKAKERLSANLRSFHYTRIWYTFWLVNFDRFCQFSSIIDADEKFGYRGGQRPFNEWRAVQICEKKKKHKDKAIPYKIQLTNDS